MGAQSKFGLSPPSYGLFAISNLIFQCEDEGWREAGVRGGGAEDSRQSIVACEHSAGEVIARDGRSVST